MLRSLLVTVAVLFAFGAQAVIVDTAGVLDCNGLVDPTSKDPVARTIIVTDKKGRPAVTHITIGGATYVRLEQYKNIKVWTENNYTTYWSGRNIRKPTTTMVGKLVPGGEDNAFYSETLYEKGKRSITYSTTCTIDEGGAP